MLPRVRSLLVRAVELAAEIRQVTEGRVGAVVEGTMDEVNRLRNEAQGLMAKIGECGVEVKGLEAGLLDFPALRNGELVYLCWRVGEPRIEWWHPVHTGFAGRQPLGHEDRWEWCN